ncbi:MAG: helix-turn-helix domain-containing protein [Oscillospiraceae bacterium]|jgi:excisionase family DNA binding protein
MFEDYPDVLSAEEAAEALRIRENAIYRLLNEGRLKAFKNGRTWKIPKEALRSYVLEAAKLRNL